MAPLRDDVRRASYQRQVADATADSWIGRLFTRPAPLEWDYRHRHREAMALNRLWSVFLDEESSQPSDDLLQRSGFADRDSWEEAFRHATGWGFRDWWDRWGPARLGDIDDGGQP